MQKFELNALIILWPINWVLLDVWTHSRQSYLFILVESIRMKDIYINIHIYINIYIYKYLYISIYELNNYAIEHWDWKSNKLRTVKGLSDVTPMITASGSYDSVTISILSYKMPIGLYKIQIFICMHYLWWASLLGHQYNMLVKTYLWNIKLKEPIIPCCQC